jgi:DNA (cytosine-5)-methyltransferase 1
LKHADYRLEAIVSLAQYFGSFVRKTMRFVDLFSGLGGFHLALEQLGHRCVFASEVDSSLQNIYTENFGFTPSGDIRKVPVATIPAHEILCAGFPCQPFSKAGEQDGFDCPSWGDLFDRVVAILKHHEPEYVLLENVPNLLKHDGGKTWGRVVRLLKRAGYESDARILSPHQFGVPQIRERVYIVARRGGLNGFAWPERQAHPDLHVDSVLEKNPADAKPLTKQVIDCLEMWQRFIRRYPKKEHLPTFPIWAMEFGANYPYEKFSPASMKPAVLRKFRGAYGKPLAKVPDKELLAALPPYARADKKAFPDWKIDFILKNRELYHKNKKWIDGWKDELLAFPPSLQKLEWNCKGGERDIWKYVIQFRASGVRVKKPTTAPSLIAMTVTQVPIIAWENRYMTPRECAKLQSMEKLRVLPEASTAAYKALGNAINVHVMRLIAEALVGSGCNGKPATAVEHDERRVCVQAAVVA